MASKKLIIFGILASILNFAEMENDIDQENRSILCKLWTHWGWRTIPLEPLKNLEYSEFRSQF